VLLPLSGREFGNMNLFNARQPGKHLPKQHTASATRGMKKADREVDFVS